MLIVKYSVLYEDDPATEMTWSSSTMAWYFSPRALTLLTTLVGAVAAKPLMRLLYS